MGKSGGSDMLVVGKITGCYGIKGWLKVHAFTEAPESFLRLGGWQVKRRGQLEGIEFDQIKLHGKGLVAHIAGVDDRTQAEAYKGLDIVVPGAVLPVLQEGDYYWRDLEGLQVVCHSGGDRQLLGKVDYLIETGANDVLVVKACTGSIDKRERLIPYLPGSTVTRVDLEEGVIEVEWFLDED